MKIPVRKRKGESGQAILLVVLAMSIFLLGAAGLAIDASQMYGQRQQAQAAADAAAVAGIMSIFDGSNATAGNTRGFSTGSSFTCSTSDARTPCYYAQTLNGFNTAKDTVKVTPNPSLTIPNLSSDSVNMLQVTVSRQLTTTLMQFVSNWNPTVTASATGAIVSIVSPTPIIITHPSIPDALDMNGNTSITITGGPTRSIQINSSNSAAYAGPSSGNVDLSKAGPNDTGADFGVFGGPTTNPGDVLLGTTGHYLSPASPILDPLAGVTAPSPASLKTGTFTPGKCTNCTGCPGYPSVTSCTEYTPGLYASGINIKNDTAMFDPGIYYIQSGGFTTKNSTVGMCGTACSSDPTTKDGMLIYDTGPASGGCDASGGFTIDTNSNDVFYGAGVSASNLTAAPASPYYGILFFEDRSACAQTHTLGQGNGCFSIIGTIYITNTLSIMQKTPTQYQTVDYHGTPCTGVQNFGEIIVSKLSLQGTASINMGLFPTGFLNVRQVALVQ